MGNAAGAGLRRARWLQLWDNKPGRFLPGFLVIIHYYKILFVKNYILWYDWLAYELHIQYILYIRLLGNIYIHFLPELYNVYNVVVILRFP